MTTTSPWIWLVWVLFAAALLYVVGVRYRRVLLAPAPPGRSGPEASAAPWLYCEDGVPLDKRAAWFRVRVGGTTIVGSRPRAATGSQSTIYLTAHDLREQHLAIRYDRARGRYVVEALEGKVLHNNEPLTAGVPVPLTDGDTLDLGDLTRLRFTFQGPPETFG